MISRLRGEGGFSLVEMIVVVAILGVVIGGLATLLEQGSNAELDMNNRFQAQLNARLALDKLRRDLHCASGTHTGVTPTATSVTLDVACASGGVISWCTSGSGSSYSLYRNLGTTCSSSNTKFITNLTTGNIFWYDGQWTGSLAKLHVDLPVNTTKRVAKHTVDTYELCDVIVLRNSTRTGGVSAPTTIPNTTPAC